MKKIHVVLDSTANGSEELLGAHENLHKVSLKLLLGEREWDEDELTATQLFEQMQRTDAFPSTSQPPLGAFMRVFEPIIAAGGEVLVLTVSGGLSGTVQCAAAAARAVDEKRVEVVDTQTTALGIVNMAEQALAMIAHGASLAAVAARMREIAAATHTLFLPDSLEYLHRGGRIGGAAALLGTLLKIKPVLRLEAGKIGVLDKVRTRARAIARMLEQVKQCGAPTYIGVVHSGDAEEAADVGAALAKLYPEARIEMGEVGSVLATHAGPRAIALMYQEKLV